jgi:Domain of unknown function (DUF4386)
VAGDAVQTARNIVASERLLRIGTVSDLITFAGDVILVWALYVVLKPINRKVALLAAFWRLAECSIPGVITLNDFVALRFLSGADYLRAFDTAQLQALARLFVGVQADGFRIGFVFFGLGRPYSAICGSSRATSHEHWPLGESSRRWWWQSSLWPSRCSQVWRPS